MPEFTLEKLAILILVIVAFILFASILTGFKVGTEFWYAGCDGDIGGELVPGKGYANPTCDILSGKDNVTCEFATYNNITRVGENLTVCVWKDKEAVGGRNITCFLNERLDCKDFSQKTSPKCQEIRDCTPVSALQVAVQRLKPTD